MSIAIPTHNGAATLRETLDSVVDQLEEGVEIVVSDNASTDQTGEIVYEYQQHCRSIRYFRNSVNLGADRNFDLAVRRAEGQHVWLLSDDDRIAPGGVHRVLSVLAADPSLGAVFVNWGAYSTDFRQMIREPILDWPSDLVCDSAAQFLTVAKMFPMFVSAVIVKRCLWLQQEVERYMGTNWVHYCVLLDIARQHRVYCVCTPCVMFRSGRSRWQSQGAFYESTLTLMNILRGLPLAHYPREAVSVVLQSVVRKLLLVVYSAKLHDLRVTPSLLLRSVQAAWCFPSFWVFVLPLLLLPRGAHRLIRTIRSALRAVISGDPASMSGRARSAWNQRMKMRGRG